MSDISPYEQNVIQAFKDACAANKVKEGGEPGASPDEVTKLLHERGQLSELDTVIDIADIMKGLRNRGRL